MFGQTKHMDKLVNISLIVIVLCSGISNSSYSVSAAGDVTTMTSVEVQTTSERPQQQRCLNATIQNITTEMPHCCWCYGDTAVKCVLKDNPGMNAVLYTMLKLEYNLFIENMTFLLNNSWLGHFPVKEFYFLNLTRLEHFTELRNLRIVPSKYQTHKVPLEFNEHTFRGCSKIQELHINLPLSDTDKLPLMIEPLVNLTLLNFDNVRGISYKNMDQVMNHVTPNIRDLYLSHFQSIGQTGYLTCCVPKSL